MRSEISQQAETDGYIPLIDLSTWFEGSEADRNELATEVDEALKWLGFLVVVNHKIESSVFADCRQACKTFFHYSSEEKSVVKTSGETYRGWIGEGGESNAATYGIDTPPDLKETYAFGTIDPVDEQLRLKYPNSYAPNSWPAQPADFESVATRFWRAAKGLAEELLELMALALRLPGDTLTKECQATTGSGTFNWYWPYTKGSASEGQYRIGPHTDFGSLTILDRQPGVGGLQVKNDAGVWIDAPVVEGSLIVNTGDLLRQWTNDRWCSNEHRVLPPSAETPDEELISLVFFHEPDADALIVPLSTCVSDENPARYAPVLSDDYLKAKYTALSVG